MAQMTDSQKLDFIIQEICIIKEDVGTLKEDVGIIKREVDILKNKVDTLETKVEALQEQVNEIQLHLENQTDKNIQLLAENHITLVDKLNQAVPVADKNLAYEVKVNYLLERVDLLEKKIV